MAFILWEISEDDPIAFLVLFIPDSTDNQAVTCSMQTKVTAVYDLEFANSIEHDQSFYLHYFQTCQVLECLFTDAQEFILIEQSNKIEIQISIAKFKSFPQLYCSVQDLQNIWDTEKVITTTQKGSYDISWCGRKISS